MILSMTGYGDATATCAHWDLFLEIRSVNHRYFKCTLKLPEFLQGFDTELEPILRERLGRGSVNFQIKARLRQGAATNDLDLAALQSILTNLAPLAEQPGVTIDIASLLALPGVVAQPEIDDDTRKALGQTLRTLTAEALDRLVAMRGDEGRALAVDLLNHCGVLRELATSAGDRAPVVVTEYHQRLKSRVEQLLAGAQLKLDESDLLREIAIFAERCDITEEVTRINSHLDQFETLCGGTEQAGRKLDFVSQELLREVNTIGSKANDATIARQVVDMKALIDRIKEQVQNVA
jgi:uncharacterized protein (TIGR00255 family)